MERVSPASRTLAPHGFIGLGLIAIFWTLNWTLSGPRTHWGFFPLWLGYCLLVDALVFYRRGTSLLMRNRGKYLALFLISTPVWWFFELFNLRLQNWHYQGGELFTPFQFWFWATLSFSTVIPAVFGTAELASTFGFVKRLGRGPIIRADQKTTLFFFVLGWVMVGLMLTWPRYFFWCLWLALYFIMEPVNVWLGNRSLAHETANGNWRPVIALWIGVLVTGFFWEMWNFFSFPKWIYSVPFVDWFRVFEMPLLGYGGYLPFALELFAFYHFLEGLFGRKKSSYVQVEET